MIQLGGSLRDFLGPVVLIIEDHLMLYVIALTNNEAKDII